VLAASEQAIIYVDQNAQGANNGSSWQHAYTDLQSALAVAQAGDQIWVARGVYYPTASASDRTVSFALKDGVELYGGFVGTETELSQRNWELNTTILSGDIDRNDTHTDGIVLDTTGLSGTNSYHVITATNVGESTVIDGFVITAGWANADAPNDRGGAIHIDSGSLTLRNLSFFGNAAQYGGALYNPPGSSTNMSNVSFSGNNADQGGAIYNNIDGRPSISNARFLSNSARVGGAIFNYNGSDQSIDQSSFSGNSADEGGTLFNFSGNLNISNTSFSGNSGRHGTVIYNYAVSSATVINASISGNYASGGGAVVYNNAESNTSFSNSINSSLNVNMGGSITTRYSLVEGCNPGGVWNHACGSDGGGNLAAADPLFVNPISYTIAPTTTGDLRLQSRT